MLWSFTFIAAPLSRPTANLFALGVSPEPVISIAIPKSGFIPYAEVFAPLNPTSS